MRAIIIGAGRGIRLMPMTADSPKCFAEVQGRSILEWTLEAFCEGGVDDVAFIGGYQIDKVRERHPQLTFRENRDWKNNNILASLMVAEDLMDEPFICAYSDILFTADVVRKLVSNGHPITLAVDTRWEERYEHRTEHPPDDAEKVTISERRVTRVDRNTDPREAHGEYIGVAGFDREGAATLREHYHEARREYAGRQFREAALFEKAYLIQLLQHMLEKDVAMSYVETHGEYMEIDTQQDFDLAQTQWSPRRVAQGDRREISP